MSLTSIGIAIAKRGTASIFEAPCYDEQVITACKRSLRQGNIFIGVCQEFCSQGRVSAPGGCLLPRGEVSAPGGSFPEGGVCSQGWSGK